jgi:Tol biopolymer transport system component
LPGKITFQSANNIFVINPDGSGRHKVTQGFSPRFSPDGRRIAFITPDGAAVASVRLDGSDLQYHCGTGGQISRVVRWSPSGKFIAVYSRENGPGVSIGAVQLCDTTAKGVAELRNAKALGQNSVHVWEWSSDGNSSVFQINTPNSAGQALYDLWYGDPDKGVDAATPLTLQNHVAITQAGVFYLDVRISPTNRSMAVVGDKIFFLNVPGQQSKLNEQTLDQFNLAQGVAWSPDTEALLVAGKLGTEDGLFLYHFDSGKITKLVSDYTEGQIDWTRQ